MCPAIEAKNLSLSYDFAENKSKKERTWIFKDLNFQIEAGEFILFTGASGCGKSSLMNMINGVIPNLKDAYTEGDVYIRGKEMTGATIRDRIKKVGSVFQNPREQIIFDEVSDEIVFPMENLGKTPQKMQESLEKLLKLCGLAKNAKTATLSGGEKQKLMTACTLGMGQKILILDEPLANMDTRSTVELLKLLKQLSGKEGYTVVLVEHREEMVLPYADKVFACVESGSENINMEIEIWEDIEAYREKICSVIPEELRSAAQRKSRKAIPEAGSGYEIRSPKQSSGERRQDRGAREQNTEKTAQDNGEEIIFSVENMTFKINERFLFRNFSWEIKRGEEWLVLGENGCGKTTLFKLLNDFEKPTSGKISSLYSKKEKRRKIGYVLQNPDYQLFMPSVRDELYLNTKSPDFVAELIQLFGFEDMATRHPLSLSEGQKRKLGFACIVANEPELLFLDEPTVGLDTASVKQLLYALALLRDRSQKNLTVISISHDKRVIPYLGDRILKLGN